MTKIHSLHRGISERWAVWLVLLTSIAVTAWPGILFPLAQAYVRFCAALLQNTILFYHVPPYLAASIVASGSVMLVAAVRMLRRQVSAQRHLAAFARWHSLPVTSEWAGVAVRSGVSDRLSVMYDAGVYAFCAGWLKPRIYVSAGLLQTLTPSEVEAVLRHEAHHLRRRDPLRLLLLNVVQSLMAPLPAFSTVAERIRTRIELAADRAALEQVSVEALAGALVKVARAESSTEARLTVAALTPTEARVAALLGRKPVIIPFRYRELILSAAVVLTVSATLWHLAQLPFPMIPYCDVCPSY